MNSSRFESPDALLRRWYAAIDAAIDARNRCIAMVVRVVPGSRIEGFGSGLFYSKDGWPFFVTAKHVLDDVQSSIQRGEGAFLKVRGRKEIINLSKSEFFCSAEWDVAITPLWRTEAASYSHVEFLTSAEVGLRSEAELLAFTGYPASRNKTFSKQEMKPNQRVITFTKPKLESSDPGFPFLLFPIARKGLRTSDLGHTSLEFPQGLGGMSGGPVFAIGGTIERPTMSLSAMGVAWQAIGSLKALRFDVVDAWLSHYFTW